MVKKRGVMIRVDEDWFHKVFEANRKALQQKLNKINLSQRDFTAIDVRARRLLRGVRRKLI